MIQAVNMRCGFLRICSLLLAVSVLFAGMSAGHAAGFQGGGHVHVAHFGAGASDGTHLNSSPQHKADCDKPSEEKAGAGNKSSGGMDGCCHVACFPSVAAQDLSDLSAHVFEAERLVLPHDEAVVSNNPQEQFRPPRPRG